jgi:DNA invertase Pin-like site-specific DNA recombinase
MTADQRQLSERARAIAKRHGSKSAKHGRRDWTGEPGAIYCRISHVSDDDQTGVERQERICAEIAQRLGIVVSPSHVFVDNNRSAWKRNRKRPGWDKLLEAARAGEITHVLCYHPDRLMRQPHDLEELIQIADDRDITLHGQANLRDLADPDDRFFLRIEVAHACRSSDDTSRRMTDFMVDQAGFGKPHTGKRRFGYTADGLAIVEEEKPIVEEIFKRYLKGDTPGEIADSLNGRRITTALGHKWSDQSVRQLLDCPHVAGIRVFRGEELGRGNWPAIISEGLFREAQKRRERRAAVWSKTQVNKRYYLLRGIVFCKRCTVHMSGSMGNSPQYACARRQRAKSDPERCTRAIGAKELEKFVIDAALDLLERLDPAGQVTQAVTTDADDAAIENDRRELAEAKEMWEHEELSLSEYRAMKRTIEARIKKHQPTMITRPTAEILKGLIGPDARPRWKELEAEEDYPRMNSVLQYLFAAVIIDEATAGRGKFDFGRIKIDQNPL